MALAEEDADDSIRIRRVKVDYYISYIDFRVEKINISKARRNSRVIGSVRDSFPNRPPKVVSKERVTLFIMGKNKR